MMKLIVNVISPQDTKETLQGPASFHEETHVTNNEGPELFMTRAEEQTDMQLQREQKALMRLVALATEDIAVGQTYSVEDALARLQKA